MDQAELQKQILAEFSKPEFIYAAIAVLVIRITVWILMANTMKKTLNLIAEGNRCIKPNQVFGIAIPLFNIYWNFVVIKLLRDSLINEFYDRKIAVDEAPTYKKGSYYAWIYLLTNFPIAPFVAVIAIILHILTLINYWVEINSYKRILEEHNKFRSGEEFEQTHEN